MKDLVVMMFKLSKKDLLLLSLILLSQIHIFFRGMDFDILWILNGIYKSTSKTVFLFVKHLSEFVLIYCLYKIGIPKNFHVVTLKNLLVYLAIILIAVFISVPSKEFITFIYITWIVLMYKNRKRKLKTVLLISFTLLFFFAYFFRQYFALVVLLAMEFQYSLKQFPVHLAVPVRL